MQNAVNQIARELACIENNITMLADTLADINPTDGVTRRKYQAYLDELKSRRDAITWTLNRLGFGADIERKEDGTLTVYVDAPTCLVNVFPRRNKKERAA